MLQQKRKICPEVLILLATVTQIALSTNTTEIACPSQPLHITVLALPPYAELHNESALDPVGDGIICDFIRESIQKCFLACDQVNKTQWRFVTSTQDLVTALLQNATDFAFPITDATQTLLYGYDSVLKPDGSMYPHLHFDTLLESPGMSYVIHMGNLNRAARQSIVTSLVGVWPVILVNLILAMIAGMFVWLMEFKQNRSEFPKNFFQGSYEGFWWAFVSMTTVGYGDKTPKSVIGRVFGTVWIMVGLVIIGIFTAAATSALSVGDAYYTAGPHGNRVGVFQDTQAAVEAVHRSAQVTGYTEFEAMTEDLDSNKLDGLLIDRYEASYLLNMHHDDNERVLMNIDAITNYKMARIESRAKVITTNRCMKTRIARANKIITHHFLKKYVKPIKVYNTARNSEGLFSSQASSTIVIIAILLGVFAVFLLMGALYQCCYRRINRTRRSSYITRDETELVQGGQVITDLQKSIASLAEQISSLQEKLNKLQSSNEMVKINEMNKNGKFNN